MQKKGRILVSNQSNYNSGKMFKILTTQFRCSVTGSHLFKPPDQGAPNDHFLSNVFKRCFRLSGVLLKLCGLILCCGKKICLFGYSSETLAFPNLLGLFCRFPENLGAYRLPENDSLPFSVPKTTFLTIHKQQA